MNRCVGRFIIQWQFKIFQRCLVDQPIIDPLVWPLRHIILDIFRNQVVEVVFAEDNKVVETALWRFAMERGITVQRFDEHHQQPQTAPAVSRNK